MKPKNRSIFPTTLCLALGLFAFPAVSYGADNTWNGSSSGTWGTAANWTTILPNGDNAHFTGSTSNNAITLATAVPIFQLEFNSTGGALANYTFSGAQFQTSGSGSNITVNANVTNGATITWNNNIQSTATNRVNPGGFSVITANGSNANLVFNGNLFASIGTAGIISTIDFKLSNLAASGGTTVNGLITDSGLGKTGVTKTGGGQGVLTLNGANTYTGQTQWSTDSGSFVVGNKAAFGTGALRVVGSSSLGSISANTTLTGANAIANTINYVGATGTANTTAVYTVTAGSTAATLVSGTSPAVGDIFLTGGNNVGGLIPIYTRVTAVSGTSITLDTPAALSGNTTAAQASTAAYTSSGTGTLTIAGTNAVEFSGIQNLSSVYSNLGASARTFNVTNTADTTFSGVLQQTGGTASIIKTGTGKLILSANNTYTGGTTISTGILQLGSGGTTGSLSTTGAIVNNANLTINRSNAVVQGTDFNSAAISGSGSLTLAGTGTTTLTAANTFTGGTTINSGSTLSLGNGGATGALSTTGAIVNNGTLILNRTAAIAQGTDFSSAAITGTGSLVLNNITNAYVNNTISSANTYSGTTTIRSGFLNVGSNSITSGTNGPLGNATSAIILGDAGTTATTYNVGAGDGPNVALFITGSGSTAYSITRNIDSSATANVAGRNNLGFIGSGTGTLTVSSNWALSSGNIRQNGLYAKLATQTLDFTGVISGGNSATMLRAGDWGQGLGVVRLSNAANSYTSQTAVSAGTLLIAGNAAAGSGVLGANSALILGDFSANDSAALTDGAYSVAKTITLQNIGNATKTWTLGGNTANDSSFTGNITPASLTFSPTLNLSQVAGGTTTFSGVIAANPNVTNVINVAKIGTGTAILTNANTYDGITTVTAGTLLASNSTGSATGAGSVTVGASGTLGGSGTISGAVNVSGVLAPGASIESLGTGALSFATGSTLAYELNSTALNGDLVDSTGTLDIASGTILTLSDLAAGTLAIGSKLTLISYFGGWTSGELFTYNASTLADDSTFTLGANEWLFDYNDTTGGSNFSSDQSGATGFITMTVVPEPTSVLLGALGLLCTLRRRRA